MPVKQKVKVISSESLDASGSLQNRCESVSVTLGVSLLQAQDQETGIAVRNADQCVSCQ